MVAPGREPVSDALARVLADPELRERLGRAGERTAQNYDWERRIDALEQFLTDLARPRRVDLETGTVPDAQRAAG